MGAPTQESGKENTQDDRTMMAGERPRDQSNPPGQLRRLLRFVQSDKVDRLTGMFEFTQKNFTWLKECGDKIVMCIWKIEK